MFTKKDVETISQELKKFAGNHSFIDLLCMHGSRSAGRATKGSDIDFYIAINGNPKKVVIKLFNSLSKETSLVAKDHYFWEFYGIHASFNGKKVSIHIISTNVLENKLRHIFKDKNNFEKGQYWASGWVKEATPLYDPKGLFKKLQNYIKYNEKFRKEWMKKKKIDIIEAAEYAPNILRKDSYVAYAEIDHMIRAIIDYLYLKNRSFQLAYYRVAKKDIKSFKPNLSKEILYLIEKPNTKKYIKEKVKIFSNIVKSL